MLGRGTDFRCPSNCMWNPYVQLLERSLSTNGVVVSETPVHSSDDGSSSLAPVFSFPAANGQTYTITSNVSTNPPDDSVAQRVKVLYENSIPAVASLDYFWQLWTATTISSILGLIASATRLALLKIARRRSLQLA